MARVYTMTNEAWENGTDWDTAIYNGENELGADSERYGVE